MADSKDKRALKGYVFDSFDHKKISDGINLQPAYFFSTKEHKSIGDLIDKFNLDEHKSIGDLIQKLDPKEHKEIRNVIQKFNSDNDKATHDLVQYFNSDKHKKIKDIISIKFNSDEHIHIGNSIKVPTSHENETLPSAEHKLILHKVVKPRKDEDEENQDTGKDYVDGMNEELRYIYGNLEPEEQLVGSGMKPHKGWSSHQNVGLLHAPIEHWAIGKLIDQLIGTILETEKSVEKEAEEDQEMGKDYASAISEESRKDHENLEPGEDSVDGIKEENKDQKDSGGKRLLTLPNGAALEFGEILALAGDFYGVADAPISNALNPDQVDAGAPQRFNDAYATLAITPYEGKHKERLEKLRKMLAEDIKETDKKGKCHHSDKEWDEATGGSWMAGLPIIHGYMLKLAEHNHDHFLPHAKTAYLVGHEYAIREARKAGRSRGQDREKLLSEAFAIDAFACHFLTDAFASGHVRTPRVDLAMNVTPSILGDLLCKYMHDEDNKHGLHVTNVRGDKWTSYGDGMLMEKCSKRNYDLVVEAVQKSVDQVHQAYRDTEMELDPSEVTDLIPFVDSDEKNNTPLFTVKDGEIHRRSDINDLQDTKTVTNWWGSTTALKLQWYKPQNSAI